MSSNISIERANNISTEFDSGVVTDNSVITYSNLFYPYILDNAGNNKIISLTIDVLNKDELLNSTNDCVNKTWVSDERLRNNLIHSKDIWGFKEAFHSNKKSQSIANAFCFGGQNITFYIEPQGHGVGSNYDEWLYCKTELSISTTNLVTGTNEILYVFDNFESDPYDDSRYFTWSVPEQNNDLFSSMGLFGLVVIRLDINRTYYEDAEFKNPVTKSLPNSNQAHLQLLIYSGSKEIIDINAGELNVLNSTPVLSDSLLNIFSYTIFEKLKETNKNELTNNQKRAIIADQIALLFMSQHFVINADFYPSKIIGGGATSTVEPKKGFQEITTYLQTNPEMIPMVNDRLFGMFATYKAFNFTEEMQSFIPDSTQSNQDIIDPVRIILTKENGVVSEDMGVKGVLFDPYGVDVLNAEANFYVPNDVILDVSVYNNTIDIYNLNAKDIYNQELSYNSKNVVVSFDLSYGEDDISQIRYSFFTKNNLNSFTYVDEEGESRLHVFTIPDDTPLVPNPSEEGEIIYIQLDIEDITGNTWSFTKTKFIEGFNEPPYLTDLQFYQRVSGDKIVDIFYTYNAVEEINNSYLMVQFSVDGGANWSNVPINSLKGDFGSNIMPGRRKITWLPENDLEDIKISGNILCRLIMYNTDNELAKGDFITGVLVWDVNKPEVAIRKLSLDEEADMIESSSSSLSSSSSSYAGICCDSYTVEGFSVVDYNGMYDYSGSYYNGKPYYLKNDGKVIYWWTNLSGDGKWRLGSNIGTSVAQSYDWNYQCPDDGPLDTDGHIYCTGESSSSSSI